MAAIRNRMCPQARPTVVMEVAEPSTFVKVDRNIINWRWFHKPNTMLVWLWLILSANIEDHDFMNETIHRGEVATSRKSISAATGLSEREVRTALEHLKSTGEIAVRVRSKYQVITILCYEKYQGSASGNTSVRSPASVRQASGKRPQSKNVRRKESKNERMCVGTQTQSPTVEEAVAFFAERGRSRSDAERFHAYNSQKGWMIGTTPITDWKQSAAMWIAQGADTGGGARVAVTQAEAETDDFGRPIKPEYAGLDQVTISPDW